MDGEIVKIELTPELRLRLAEQLQMGLIHRYGTEDFNELKLGFKLGPTWPLEGEVLLSQLIVLAHKLKMQIIIGDIALAPII